MGFLNNDGLQHFWQGIKEKIEAAVPTDNSQLANGAGYQTEAQVQALMSTIDLTDYVQNTDVITNEEIDSILAD